MFLNVAGKIVLPILMAILILALILSIVIWFILTRYKFLKMMKEIKVLEDEIDANLLKKKDLLIELLKNEELQSLELGNTVTEKNDLNLQLNMMYQQNEEFQEETGMEELLQTLLDIEGDLGQSIHAYNLAVAKLKAQALEFPNSLVVGSRYEAIAMFDEEDAKKEIEE